MTEDEPAFYEVCANCGASLGIEEWPPVVAKTEEDGESTYYSFCDETCKAAWRNDG